MLFERVSAYLSSGFRPRVHIIGTGPAGISLALRLQQKRVPCLLIEAGDFQTSAASQAFYRGEVVGDHYHQLDEARLRQFGGSSGHWSGWCCPLDRSDFEPNEYIPNSGWPIRKDDLDPYATAAEEVLELRAAAAEENWTPGIDKIQYRFSPPVRFGTKYRDAVEKSDSIGLLANVAVKELVPGDGRIASLVLVDFHRREYTVPVETVCVCTGGIENSRLLLWSNQRYGGRVVPRSVALGRYWMEHPVFALGDAITFDGFESQYEAPSPQKPYFAPSLQAKKKFGIGGAHIWLRANREQPGKAKVLFHDLMCVAPTFSNKLLKLVNREYHCGATIIAEYEQVPLQENRIELSRTLDAFGVQRVRLYWQKSEQERKTAAVCARLFGDALVKYDVGRMRVRNWLNSDSEGWPSDDQGAGWHHMGGTRMALSPATGVVDRDCRVFDMANLYVGGSSVFATGGHASPTYTIVQLALRLGDHISARLAKD